MKTISIKEFAFDYILEQDNLSREEKLLLGVYVKESDKYQVMHLLAFGTMVPPMTEEMNKDMQIFFNCLSEIDWRKVGVQTSVKAGQALEKGAGFAKQKGFEKAVDLAYKPKEGISALKRLARSWANYNVQPGTFNIGRFKIKIPKVLNKQWHAQYIKANAALHAGAALAAAAAAAMIFMAARKAYKTKFSKAARACKSYKGTQKDECIRKFRVDAIKEDIKVMESNKTACKAARDPGRCMSKVDKRIKKQKNKLEKILTKKKVKP